MSRTGWTTGWNTTNVDELGHADDCAALVHYLASDDSRFINAQAIAVDAGATTGHRGLRWRPPPTSAWTDDDPFEPPPVS